MVDFTHIQKALKKYFYIEGQAHIDEQTGVINIQGSVYLKKPCERLPVVFGKVSGDFEIRDHLSITSLQGSPVQVGGTFRCMYNNITSLEHGPALVGRNYEVGVNNLVSLQGAPKKIWKTFNCKYNYLKNFIGSPEYVSDGFFATHNSRLTSLEGLPAQMSQGNVTWLKHLPLLRVFLHKHMEVHQAPEAVQTILKKYQGQGRPGALLAAAELIRAGYAENARW